MRVYMRRPIRERLLERLVVDLHTPSLVDGAPCWIWTGGKRQRGRGYGSIGRGGKAGGSLYPHIVAYELQFGPVREGLELDHRCQNPACCNPAHLEAVTKAVNLGRGRHGGGRPVGSKLAPATIEKIRQAALVREAARRVPWSAEVRQG